MLSSDERAEFIGRLYDEAPSRAFAELLIDLKRIGCSRSTSRQA